MNRTVMEQLNVLMEQTNSVVSDGCVEGGMAWVEVGVGV